MNLVLTLRFVSGETVAKESSDYASVDACRQVIEKWLNSQPGSVVNWHNPDGSVDVIPARHVVSVNIAKEAS
jgi:hypothetical protein